MSEDDPHFSISIIASYALKIVNIGAHIYAVERKWLGGAYPANAGARSQFYLTFLVCIAHLVPEIPIQDWNLC